MIDQTKILPSAVEFEEVIVGAILLDSGVLSKVSDIIHPDSFYVPANGKIYAAAIELGKRGQPIDILTVSQALRKSGELQSVGGSGYISKLTTKVTGTAHIETWARMVSEKYMLREIIRITGATFNEAYSETTDLFDLMDKHHKAFAGILQDNVKGDAILLGTLSKAMLDNMQARNSVDNYMSGLPTRILSVDRILGGFKKSDLIYVGARPSMGKTGFIVSCALEQARAGHSVAIFSLEMSKEQLRDRFVAQITGIDLEIIMNKQIDEGRLEVINRAVGEIDRLKIYIDDTPALSVYDFQAKTARLKKRNKIDITYVDYVQLMTLGAVSKKMANSREQEVSQVSRILKQTAKEQDIPVVALAQLSRSLESRPKTERRPMLSDLRESGSLEQDADVVAFLYRPEYYGITEMEGGESTHGLGELVIAKHRNGKLGIAPMKFIEYTARFTNQSFDGPHPDDRIEPNREFLNKKEEKAPF